MYETNFFNANPQEIVVYFFLDVAEFNKLKCQCECWTRQKNVFGRNMVFFVNIELNKV